MYEAARQEQREKLVNDHADLVKRIAYHLISRLPPSVQVEDLIQAGTIGLLEAASKYDAAQGASFDTYAGIRVRGAMLDEIRRSDWAPRSVHKKAREITQAIREVENREGRTARDTEIAELMDMDLDDYYQMVRESTSYQVFSFEDILPSSEEEAFWQNGNKGPLDDLSRGMFREALAEGIASLPERESLVLSLYYDEELNLRDIGEVLGVSESRISQIHSQALARLKARLAEWVDNKRQE
jgi:RNA polymerase sigma factor for flagellar operon FliA